MHYTLRSYDDQLFKDIVTYVNEKNLGALKAILERGFPLDPLSGILNPSLGMVTPAGYFAYQGNHDAVKLLMDLRADLGYVMDGYAAAGDYERVFQMVPSDASDLKQIAARNKRIARAAARRNEFELVQDRLGSHSKLLDRIVTGYAMGGHVAAVDHFIKEKTPTVDFEIRGSIILVGDFIDLRGFIPLAAFGFSIQKHFKLLDQLLINAKHLDADDPIDSFNRYEQCLNLATLGYAQAGEFEKAKELVNKGAHINFLIKGAACYGNTELVEQLVLKISGDALEAALEGFILRDSFVSPATTIQLLAFIDNRQIRQDIAARLQKDNKNAPVHEWLAKAIQLNELMRGKDLPYDQAVSRLNAQSRAAHSFMPPPLQVPVVVAEQEEYTLTVPKIT